MQQHTFDVQIAKVLGVHKAILLQYIEFWALLLPQSVEL